MKTGDPSDLRTQESEASQEQSDCSYLAQTFDTQERRAFTNAAKLLKLHVRLHKFQCFNDLMTLIPLLSNYSEWSWKIQEHNTQRLSDFSSPKRVDWWPEPFSTHRCLYIKLINIIQWLMYVSGSLTSKISAFCPKSVYLCFVYLSSGLSRIH